MNYFECMNIWNVSSALFKLSSYFFPFFTFPSPLSIFLSFSPTLFTPKIIQPFIIFVSYNYIIDNNNNDIIYNKVL